MELYVGLDLQAMPVGWNANAAAAPPTSLWINTAPPGAAPIFALRYRLDPGLFAKIALQLAEIDAACEAGRLDRTKAQTAVERFLEVRRWCEDESNAGNVEWLATPGLEWWNAAPMDTPLPTPIFALDQVKALRSQADAIFVAPTAGEKVISPTPNQE